MLGYSRCWKGGRAHRRGCVPKRVHLGQSEVQDLGLTALGYENICRFDIAMSDAFAVRGVERVGDVDGNIEKPCVRQGPPSDQVMERSALEQFHGDEVLSLKLVNLVNGADMGVVQGGRRASFALEPL